MILWDENSQLENSSMCHTSLTSSLDFPDLQHGITFTFHFPALEKEMATHSSVLAWRILGTGVWWAAVYGVAQSRTQLK